MVDRNIRVYFQYVNSMNKIVLIECEEECSLKAPYNPNLIYRWEPLTFYAVDDLGFEIKCLWRLLHISYR